MRLERLPRDRLPQSTVARGSLRTTSLEAGLIDSERRAAMVAATNDQANACTACTAVLGASTGAQVLSRPPLAANDAAAVAKALRGSTYDSAVGVLAFDQKGDIKNPVYDIYVWKNGKSSPIN
jgi:branched-chain amino acid transport system substrate-binding protein